jgi:hypothetical protein
MSDVITGLRQVIQDLVAPDLKALTVKVDALQKQGELQYEALTKNLDAFSCGDAIGVLSLKAN